MRWNASTIGRRQRPVGTLAPSGLFGLREQATWRRENRWNQAIDTPSTIGTLALWLDGSDRSSLYDATTGGSLVTNGGAVARWEDKSGNGRHATQSTANNRPIWQSYGDVGGLLFDGSNDTLTGSFPTLGEQTVFLAVKLHSTAQFSRIFSQRNTGQQDFSQTGHYIPFIHDTGLAVGSWADSAVRLRTNTEANVFSIAAIHDGSALKIRLNGVDSATYNHTLNGTFAQYAIASDFSTAVAKMLLFEVVAFNTALSSGDLTKMDDYFKLKYGVAL